MTIDTLEAEPSQRPMAASRAAISASLRALLAELSVEDAGLAERMRPLLDEVGETGTGGGLPAGSQAYFPSVDYRRHPYYREFPQAAAELRAAVSDRFLTAFSGQVRAELAFANRAARADSRGPALDAAATQALQRFRDAGVHTFRLSASQRAEIIARSQPAADALEARRAATPANRRGVEGVLQTLAEAATPDADYEFYDGVLQDAGIHQLLQGYYGCPVKLLGVNLQINSGEDTGISRVCSFPDGRTAPTYYMHIDSGAGIFKVLMYRSEKVTADNGAFRYSPGSHRAIDPVQRAIRKANDKARFDGLRENVRQEFMALPDCLRKKANFGNDLIAETGVDTEGLLAREVVLDGEAGFGVLADVSGVHRGNIHADPHGRREMFKFVLKAQKT